MQVDTPRAIVIAVERLRFEPLAEDPGSIPVNVYTLDPLTDRRWADFVESQPLASVFHTRGWLEAVRRSHGYEPVAYTTSHPAAALTNGVLLCRVCSWLTGRRMVGVPFADHCEPLVESQEDREAIFSVLLQSVQSGTWKYVELRPRNTKILVTPALRLINSYCFHTLDLQPPLEEIFRAFHKNSIQRKLRRAERESLSYEQGRSEALLHKFYRLQLLTRQRHRLPPQPLDWFRNLSTCLSDQLTIHVVSKDGRPAGAIITIRHRDTLVYKYGASDARFHKLGTMPLLFWHAIREGKRSGVRALDLGRSQPDNAGLLAFKDHLGAARSISAYVGYSALNDRRVNKDRLLPAAKLLFSCMPDRMLVAAGKLFYKHIG